MKEVLLLLIGALLSVGAFFAKRALRKDNVSEAIARKRDLLALLESMKANGVSMEELDALEMQFERRQRVREIEDRLTIELKTQELGIPRPGETQAEMNLTAAANLQRATARMHLIRDGLVRFLSPQERALEDEAQRAWTEYRNRHADYAAAQFEGGSIQPLIRMAELERLTIERAAILESDLEFRRSVSIPCDDIEQPVSG